MTVQHTYQSAARRKSRSNWAVQRSFGVSLGDKDQWPSEPESDGDSGESCKPPPSPTGPRNILRQLAHGGVAMSIYVRDDGAGDTDSQSSVPSDYEYAGSDADMSSLPPNAHPVAGSPRGHRFLNPDSDEDGDNTDEDDNEVHLERQQSTPSRQMADVSVGSRHHAPDTRQRFPQSSLGNLPPLPQPPADYVALPPIVMPTGQIVEPVPFSNANPSVLGLENLGLFDFLRGWAAQRHFGAISGLGGPDLQHVLYQESLRRKEVSYEDLKGDYCDFQGLNWQAMGTTRKAARSRRRYTYRNYVNRQDSDKWNTQHCSCVGKEESNFFKFKCTNFQSDIRLAHFQLRSILGCPNRNTVFFPGHDGIQRFHTLSRQTETFMRVPDFAFASSTVTSLDADYGVLLCGTFEGNYCVKSLESETTTPEAKGQISKYESGITNYIKIEKHRSSPTVAAIASNDDRLRLYDVTTDTFLAERLYPVAMNCTALSPDGQLRALVGDADKVFITDERTGAIQFELHGHRDYGFACAWSDDGRTLATGSQDMAIKIWDARYWQDGSGTAKPLHTIKSELAGARTLKFSPIGSGPRVLVAAEEADYVNIIDAITYETKQTVDVFGEICGAAFTADGQNLNILCRDVHRGGLLQFERCGGGLEKLHGMPRTDRWVADDDVVDPF